LWGGEARYVTFIFGACVGADLGLIAVFAVAGAVLAAIEVYVVRERPGRNPRA
jgi:hypothetical protein